MKQPATTRKSPAGVARPRASLRKSGDAARTGLRALVVEDHADTRKGLELFLKMLGWEVQFAPNFETALNASNRAPFDLLLSDVNLPDGNGWELLRRLEARDRRPAMAIAMSGYGTDQDIARSKAAGYNVHLVKPVRPEQLESTLKSARELILRAKRKKTPSR